MRHAALHRHQHIGKGGEPEPELIGLKRCRRGAVGKQIELAFLG
jgi:hypothetical protein